MGMGGERGRNVRLRSVVRGLRMRFVYVVVGVEGLIKCEEGRTGKRGRWT